MKLIDKLKAQVKTNITKSAGKKKLLFKFEEAHYKAKMASSAGFGVTDLKPNYYNLYNHLMKTYGTKGKTIVMEPGDLAKKEVIVSYKVGTIK